MLEIAPCTDIRTEMVNGLVVALLYLAFNVISPWAGVWGRLSLTAAVSLCCRWEREINNLSMEMWPSKYGQGLSFPSHPMFVLNYRNTWHRRHFVFCLTSFSVDFFSPSCCTPLTFFFCLPWKEPLLYTAMMPVYLPLNLYYNMLLVVVVALFGLISLSYDINVKAVIYRWGFKFKMWTNLCTVGLYTASSQSYARSR